MQHDVVIAGGGPAALSASAAIAERGARVLLLAGDDAPWPASYGGWVDELSGIGVHGADLAATWHDALVHLGGDRPRSLGRAYARLDAAHLRERLLAACAEHGVQLRAEHVVGAEHDATGSTVHTTSGSVRGALVVDATGHRPALVERAGEATAFQAAVGFTFAPGDHPFDRDRATFMDLRTDHVDDALGEGAPTFLYAMPHADGRLFVEETSLLRAPAVPFSVLRERLLRRLARHGLEVGETWDHELCLIPMDTPLPRLDQRVVGFGGAASMVHPASGYLLPRALGAVSGLADVVVGGLGAGGSPATVATRAWRTLWRSGDLLRRELHLFGSGLLAAMTAEEQRRFFAAFFSMPRATWGGYLDGSGNVGGVVRAMASMLALSGLDVRMKLLRAGARLPGVLFRAAV